MTKGKELPSGANTVKRDRFAMFWAQTGNKVKAREEAGYPPSDNAATLAERLSRGADVQKAFQYHSRRLAQKLDLRGENVLKEVAALAFSNMADYLEAFDPDADGKAILEKLAELPREKTAAIQKIKFTRRVNTFPGGQEETTYETELVLHGKWQPLKHIGQMVKDLAPKDKRKKRAQEVKINWNKSQENTDATTTEQDGPKG